MYNITNQMLNQSLLFTVFNLTQTLKLLGRHLLIVIISLHFWAAWFIKEFCLFLIFNALGYQTHPQSVCHLNHMLYDNAAFLWITFSVRKCKSSLMRSTCTSLSIFNEEYPLPKSSISTWKPYSRNFLVVEIKNSGLST